MFHIQRMGEERGALTSHAQAADCMQRHHVGTQAWTQKDLTANSKRQASNALKATQVVSVVDTKTFSSWYGMTCSHHQPLHLSEVCHNCLMPLTQCAANHTSLALAKNICQETESDSYMSVVYTELVGVNDPTIQSQTRALW